MAKQNGLLRLPFNQGGRREFWGGQTVPNLLEAPEEARWARGWAQVEEAFPTEIHQKRIKSEVEGIEEGVLDNCTIHCSGGQLEMLVMEEIGDELKNSVPGNVSEWLPGLEVLKSCPT